MEKTRKYGEKTELALDTWVKLARAFTTFNNLSIKDIRSFRLTQAQFAVIEALGHLGPLKIGELCRKMLISGGNMTLVLDNLERLEFIERVPSKKDRRAINIQLTQKGEELFNEIFDGHAEKITEYMSVLTEEEQEQLGKLLKKLGKSLNGR